MQKFEPFLLQKINGQAAGVAADVIVVQFQASKSNLSSFIPQFPHKLLQAGFHKLVRKLRNKRGKIGLRGLKLHHDNASSHTCSLTIDFLQQEGLKLLPHPPYSLDLASCDFYLFPKLKESLRVKLFDTEKELDAAVHCRLRELSKNGSSSVFRAWLSRCEKCIQFGGDYIEVVRRAYRSLLLVTIINLAFIAQWNQEYLTTPFFPNTPLETDAVLNSTEQSSKKLDVLRDNKALAQLIINHTFTTSMGEQVWMKKASRDRFSSVAHSITLSQWNRRRTLIEVICNGSSVGQLNGTLEAGFP
ncbi:hypothetical protein BV898_11899 [Hypsibius exemplaris]|uniref:Histone-lysine N-methyltransferase SETMAR n=1 Tax=Hypsibius exemplaris TaxID=2072580 RepID=A0A1W0WFK9_HYPEX|nr:hypothetical protein BV898_11899 [Hypsibius exemplaris]